MKRLRTARGALSYANVMATVAVFIALGGVAGAAIQPLLDKKGSVKGRHIARGAVHMSDLAPAVRKQVAGPQIAPPNFVRKSADGSLTIAMLVDWTANHGGGQIAAMGATGDCAFPYQEVTLLPPSGVGGGPGRVEIVQTWSGYGAGGPRVTVVVRPDPYGGPPLFWGISGVSASGESCDTEISFVPH